MTWTGLDVHKRVVQAVVLDDAGNVIVRERFDCTRENLEQFARRFIGPKGKVALEATTNTWAIVGVLQPLVGEVVVSNPMRTRAIAEAKIKTDKVDATILAQLLRADFLPRVWVPDEHTQQQRRLTSRRASLVSDRTRIKNRIHAVLHQRLIRASYDDLFGPKGLAWLRDLPIDTAGRAALDSELRLLEQVEQELDKVDNELATDAWKDPRVKLLMTLPGVDVAVAEAVISTLGDISRFKDGDHAAAYFGIVPSTHQSAERCYHGKITKQGRAHARWLLVQAAQHIDKHPGPLGVFFRRLAKKKNRNVAVVASARKLVVIAYHMLKNNEPYRYAIPKTTEAKLSKLRNRAGGPKRKSGNEKGAGRPAAYGTGNPTRAVRSLDQVCEVEGIPAPKPLAPGEERMIREQGLEAFVSDIHTPKRVPKKAKKGKESRKSAKQPAPAPTTTQSAPVPTATQSTPVQRKSKTAKQSLGRKPANARFAQGGEE